MAVCTHRYASWLIPDEIDDLVVAIACVDKHELAEPNEFSRSLEEQAKAFTEKREKRERREETRPVNVFINQAKTHPNETHLQPVLSAVGYSCRESHLRTFSQEHWFVEFRAYGLP